MRKPVKFQFVCVALTIGSHAWAQHAHCSYGYQDSSCGTTIATAAQTAPVCPVAAGWSTVAAAVWQGSKFSAQQCVYEAPPSCPAGSTQTSAPVWNGSSWSSPGCANDLPIPANKQPTHSGAALVAVSGFYITVDCALYNSNVSGTESALVYQATYADGYVSYYQMASPTVAYSVSRDSQGRYYTDVLGDNWGSTERDPSSGRFPPSLYTGYADPNYPPPTRPAAACLHSDGHN